MTAETRQRLLYVTGDYLMSAVAMVLFNIVRYRYFVTPQWAGSVSKFMHSSYVELGIFIIPLAMLGIFYLSGYYYDVNYRSRLEEFFSTLFSTFVGALLIYFLLIVNDPIEERGEIYELVAILWGILFGCVYAMRLALTLSLVRRLHSRRMGFNTLVVGTSQAAVTLVEKLDTARKSMGFNIVGYVDVPNSESQAADLDRPLFSMENLKETCDRLDIKHLILLPHPNGVHATMELIGRVYPTGRSIFISPFLFQLISGKSSFGNVVGEPLIDISRPAISPMTASCKRAADLIISSLALIVLSPLLAALAIAVKCDSKGPVFYTQERIGFHKHRFKIIKFRTMQTDAEADGPALSAPDDPRVTRIGRFLRKYRLDELPQFVNIVRGDMSLVGPRPEREYYVDRIVKRVPYYSMVHSVRPGLTSLGMVKYGYAMGVDEMVERLKYDLMYLENVSMGMDLKIILYTIKTVLTGKGV